MNGLIVLALTIVGIAHVGLSQPIESAKDKATVPEPTVPVTSVKPPEGDAGEGGDQAQAIEGIPEAVEKMNELNDNFLKILQTLGVGTKALESGSTTPAKGEETTPSAGDSTPASEGSDSTPASKGGDSTPASDGGESSKAPDAGKEEATTKAASTKSQ